MCVRGHNYREDYEFEMLGEDVTASLAPLKDEKFLPVAAFLKEHLGMDKEDAVEAVEEAKEEAAQEGEDTIDITKMDKEFVVALQRAAIGGLKGSYSEDGDGRNDGRWLLGRTWREGSRTVGGCSGRREVSGKPGRPVAYWRSRQKPEYPLPRRKRI
jgi:hypothetical protein